MTIEIREFSDGTFQIWKGTQVLRPDTLEWEPEYQSQHSFMYLKSKRAVRRVVKRAKANDSVRLIATYRT